jgi:alcohol dehydrogenase class IV
MNMLKPFEFYSAGQIVFGWGTFSQVGELAVPLGKRALIVTPPRSDWNQTPLNQLEQMLRQKNIVFKYFDQVTTEPTVSMIDQGVALARKFQADLVIGVGGGSCVDTGKAIAGLVTNDGSVLDYLEGVGRGLTIQLPPLPCLAIPTTAGTGAEVTKNAVIASPTAKFKKSIRSARLIPKIALVDPELTLSLPPERTAYSGLDALTQCIEAFVSKKSQPLTDALAQQGIRFAANSLGRAYQDGGNRDARTEMALCSLFSGLALANAGLGAAHGIGAALGALFGIPHGLACAVLLPVVMTANRAAMLEKYAQIGGLLTGQGYPDLATAATAGITFIEQLTEKLRIPRRLRDLGIPASAVAAIVQESWGSSMQANPRTFSESELTQLLIEIV